MINLGLTSSEKAKLDKLLVSHHRVQISVQLLDLSHRYIGDLSSRLMGGQVDFDADATEAKRTCSVDLLDPFNDLQLDGDSPDDGSIYYTTMFKIIYSVISVDRSLRFDIPLFTGPLTKVTRSGAILSCTASGKEKLGMSTAWKTTSYKKNMGKTKALVKILTEIIGEKKLSIRQTPGLLPNKLSIDKDKTPWAVCLDIARGMSKQLFYDGRGTAVLRNRSSKTIYTFHEDRSLLSEPTTSFDAEAVINAVQVIGAKPKKAKVKINYRIVAPRKHPLSPWRMGRWGKPRYLVEVIEDDSIKSKEEARRVAKTRLQNALVEQVEVAFDSLPIPYLEEGDNCRVVSQRYSGKFKLSKFSIPLTADGVMSVGYLRRVVPNQRRIKIKNLNKNRRRRSS